MKTVYSGIGFLGWLTLLFIALKLTHFIDWSWWWVLFPFVSPFVLYFIIIGVCGGIYLAICLWEHLTNRKGQ